MKKLAAAAALAAAFTLFAPSDAVANPKDEKAEVYASVDARLHALLGRLAQKARASADTELPGVKVAAR